MPCHPVQSNSDHASILSWQLLLFPLPWEKLIILPSYIVGKPRMKVLQNCRDALPCGAEEVNQPSDLTHLPV